MFPVIGRDIPLTFSGGYPDGEFIKPTNTAVVKPEMPAMRLNQLRSPASSLALEATFGKLPCAAARRIKAETPIRAQRRRIRPSGGDVG
jgi:hypothetical protein